MKKLIYTLLLLLTVCQVVEAKNIKKNKHKNKVHTITKEQWPDWLDNFIDWISSPWQPVWGEFKIDGQNTTAPMALFHSNSFTKDLDVIRTKITLGNVNDDFWKTYEGIYKDIFNSNYSPKSLVYTLTEKSHPISTWCKNAAFVYLIGLRPDGSALNSTQLTFLHDSVLNEMRYAYTRYGSNDNYFKGGDWDELQIWRSKELVSYLSAYELMRAAGATPEELFAPRDGLANVATELYTQATKPFASLSKALNNNISVITCSALIMSGIVLHDRKTTFFNRVAKPDNWANKGFIRLNETMFGALMHQTEDEGVRGFKEAGGYFAFAMESLVPAMVATNNFLGNKKTDFICNEPADLDWGSLLTFSFLSQLINFQKIDNCKYDTRWINLVSWYTNTLMQNGKPPTLDDTDLEKAIPHLAALKMDNCSVLNGTNLQDAFGIAYDARADFLAANNPAPTGYAISIENYFNKKSGDLILRNKSDNDRVNHYFHLLGETNTNIDKAKYYISSVINSGHESPDASSFLITVNEGSNLEHLAIDPPYLGYTNRAETNKAEHHSLIKINGKYPLLWDNPSVVEGDQVKKSVKVKMHYSEPFVQPFQIDPNSYLFWYMPLMFINPVRNAVFGGINSTLNAIDKLSNAVGLAVGVTKPEQASIEREISTQEAGGNLYYLMIDNCESKETLSNYEFEYNLNGNGNFSQGSFDTTGINTGKVRFYHPCKNGRKWGLKVSTVALTTNGSINYDKITTYKNTNRSNGLICDPIKNSAISNVDYFGVHSTFKAKATRTIPTTIFQSVLMPYRCLDTLTGEGIIGIRNFVTNEYAATVLDSLEPDYHKNLHVVKEPNIDSIIINDPFIINNNHNFITNADRAFFSISENTTFVTGYCNAYTFFRSARIENGKKLVYNDTAFIKSNKRCEAFYKLVGKYQYQGYIQCDSIDSVSFYLPDLDSNYAMGANGKGITYVYNDTTHIITLIAPVGRTEFLIQLADPCVMNCYFPTATDSIKNTFDFGIGIPQSLPYKLTITPPNGLLKIRNASKMQICPQKWLRNNDSLIMEGPCPRIPTRPSYSICPDVSAGGVGPNIEMMDYNDKSEITVSDYAALILDSGSYTRFGNNTRLIVMPYGSLIIRKNANVDIGDEKGCGYAEIICHPNSYVQFEDSANIKFWKKENDTNDIHVFYISVLPSLTATHAGIEPSMSTMLTNVDAIPFGTAAPICNVAQIRAGYGINNRDWGFTNFALPKAWASISQDTFCPGQCPTIDFDRMLNDTKRSIKFCRIDTNYSVSPPEAIFNTCIYPDIKGGNGGAIGGGDLCDTLQYIGPLTICNTQIDDPGKWYRITLISYNDCGQMDSINLYYYNQHVLDPSFSLAQTGCPNNIQAYENSDSISRKYREKTIWHVHLIDTTNTNLFAPQIQYGGDWEYDNLAFPNTFTFPNFKWIGGFYYAISHTVSFKGCGSKIVWDTVFVAPGANIVLRRPMTYNQTISGNRSVQLKGYVSNADSFNWNPTTWLDSTTSLTPISTPNDSITYILTAYKDGCTARDTAHIKYNRYANAGYSDTLCFDSTHSTETLVGFPYDMSLFLGMLYYYDNTQFMNYYNTYNSGNMANYFRYFTHFMHDQSFENATTPCPVNLFNVFTSTMYKELFFKKSWFKTYYQNLTSFTDPSLPALDDFNNYITSDTPLKDHLDSLDNWGNIDPCIDNLFTQYNDYVNLHANEITTSWSRITDGDTTTLTSWDNYFVAVDAPVKSSKYLLSVITPSVAEIDEITILVDTLLTPLFAPAMQFDSTVYLMNYTEPVSTATHYEWNFGDGSAHSFETHPIHTFPAFDSNYVVCLIASNLCSTFTYCDTVWIDSLHLGGSLMVVERSRNKPAFYETNISTKLNDRLSSSNKPDARSQQLVALSNYPNPFNNSTIIDYEIWQNYTNAELRITNVLGQTLFTQKLNKPIDKIQVDGGALSNGIYYYSIIIDGTVSQTKNMSVIH